MDGHAVSPFDLSLTLPVGGGLLVPYSLSGSPAINSCNWLLWCLARVGGFNQCASPNTFMFLQMTFHSIVFMCHSFLSVHLSMDITVVFMSWLL